MSYLDATANALAIDAARTRCRLEIEMLGAILCRPADLLLAARDCGATPALFAFPDLRHIFESAADDVRLGLDHDLLPHRIIHSFRQAGFWRLDHPGRGLTDMLASQHWSLRTVYELFHQNYPSTGNVRRCFRLLSEHVRATRASGEHLAHAVSLLSGAAPTAIGPVEMGLHIVRLSRLSEIPVETLADFMDETDNQRRVA